MSHHHSINHKVRAESRPSNSPTATIERASQLAEAGNVGDALKLLSSSSTDNADIRNAKAVCLMRLERPDEAVNVYRSLLLAPGCTWIQPDRPVFHITNFALSLILIGRPSGARDLLNGVKDKNHPSVDRLSEILRKWERNLSWWQWLNWRCGVDPTHKVTLSAPIGDFTDPLTLRQTSERPTEVDVLDGMKAG